MAAGGDKTVLHIDIESGKQVDDASTTPEPQLSAPPPEDPSIVNFIDQLFNCILR